MRREKFPANLALTVWDTHVDGKTWQALPTLRLQIACNDECQATKLATILSIGLSGCLHKLKHACNIWPNWTCLKIRYPKILWLINAIWSLFRGMLHVDPCWTNPYIIDPIQSHTQMDIVTYLEILQYFKIHHNHLQSMISKCWWTGPLNDSWGDRPVQEVVCDVRLGQQQSHWIQ